MQILSQNRSQPSPRPVVRGLETKIASGSPRAAALGGLHCALHCALACSLACSELPLPLPLPGPGPEPQPQPPPAAIVTRQECGGVGGVVVGDPGDGSVHAPDFLCEDGQPPLATVIPQPGEPIASEGEVCCGPPSPASAPPDGNRN